MIVKNRPNAFKLLFAINGSIVPKIAGHLIISLLFSSAIVALHHWGILVFENHNLMPFALLGISLSLFLGFRNNSAYDRWWEARKQWGSMIFEIRALAKSLAMLNVGDDNNNNDKNTDARREILNYALAYAFSLKNKLRNENHFLDIEKYIDKSVIDASKQQDNQADYYLQLLSMRIGELYKQKSIDTIGVQILDKHVHNLAAVQAACERISNTPLPFAYTLLVHRTSYIYCYFLPVMMVAEMLWVTPIFTAIVVYTFFGLDVLAEELEDPFGRHSNDLALDAMCRTNEISVAQALGDALPKPLQPVNHRLE